MAEKTSSTSLKAWIASLPNVTGYTSDSRQARPGLVFVAIPGEKTDGHQFVDQALDQGASGAVVHRDFKSARSNSVTKLFACDNPHETHRALAAHFRELYSGKIIAIGGSSGKTSTKEFLFQILSTHFQVFKTYKSQNGELGIPKTFEQLSGPSEIGLIEVGIDAPGDMIRHATLVAPDIALLSSIGEEHLNLLKDIDTVFREEKILFEVCLARGGSCYAPEQDAYLRTLKGSHPQLHVIPPNDTSFEIPLSHPYAIQNARLAARVAMDLGMPAPLIQKALQELSVPEGRGQELAHPSGFRLLADHYNANPSSLRAGLKHARESAARDRLPLYLILGDMLDLGSETSRLHHEVAADIDATPAAAIFLVGPEMAKIRTALRSKNVKCYTNSSEAARQLDARDFPKAGIVLFKGSRGMALENVLQTFTERIRI